MPRVEVFDRVHVLEKVKDLFWNKGFNGTSMQDLVDTTGLNRSSIYNSFGNKKALYELVLNQYQEENKGFFKEALIQAKNPFEVIRYIFENCIDQIINDDQGKGCFNMNCTTEMSRSDKELKHFLTHRQEASIAFYRDLVEEGQQHGVINEKDTPDNYAHYLYSAFQGLRMTGMLSKDTHKLQSIVDNILITLT